MVAIYIKYVILGVNYNNKSMIRSDTASGYAKAVNTLFELRGFPHPANLQVADNMSAVIIRNLEREEDIARQRHPLDNDIFAKLQQLAANSKSPDSVEHVVFNMVAFGRITGPRAGEYAQKTSQDLSHDLAKLVCIGVDVHWYSIPMYCFSRICHLFSRNLIFY